MKLSHVSVVVELLGIGAVVAALWLFLPLLGLGALGAALFYVAQGIG